MRPQGRPRCLTPQEIADLSVDWAASMRVIDMAFKYGVSSTSLGRIFQQHRARFPKRPKAPSKPQNRQERLSPTPTMWRCACGTPHTGVCPRCSR